MYHGEPSFLPSKKFWRLSLVYTSMCHCYRRRSPLLAHSLDSQTIQLSRGVFLFTQQDSSPGHLFPTIESPTVIICFFLSFKILSSLWGATVLPLKNRLNSPSLLPSGISLYKVLGRREETNLEPHSLSSPTFFLPFLSKTVLQTTLLSVSAVLQFSLNIEVCPLGSKYWFF